MTQINSLFVSHIAVASCNSIVAALLLICFAPVMLAIAFCIKLEGRGPVLLQQSRRTLNGEVAALWAFRTVANNVNEFGGLLGRVSSQTVLGRFLYNSRLDLLPRLINILRGEVSLRTYFD